MRVEYLSESADPTRWDAYAGARAWSVTDLSAWRRVVRDAYGIASHFYLAVDGHDVVGALALYELKHPVFGHYLASAVFGTDGGLHFDTIAARDALLAEAKTLAERRRVAYLAIRTRDAALEGFHQDERYRTAIVDLDGTAESAFTALPVKTRNQVRRGLKEGFTIAKGADQIGAFYDVFHRHMRALGSPGHGMAFYRSVLRNLGDHADIFVVRDGDAVAAGALVFRVNDTAMNYHAVALRQYSTRCANYFLYWRMLEDAYARGCRRFDMGRSEADSSQLRFKSNWKPRELPLWYNYFLVRSAKPPRLSPRNPRYRLAIAAWERLPLAITRALGPRIISGLA